LGKYRVQNIQDWQDITDSAGRTLSVSWPMGADKWVEQWL
jgi:hypothetical protein